MQVARRLLLDSCVFSFGIDKGGRFQLVVKLSSAYCLRRVDYLFYNRGGGFQYC